MSAAFDDKVAIVTGAAGGINRVILTRLAEEGASCVLVDVNDDWGEAAATALRSRELAVTYIRTDVRDSDQVNAMVARAVETYGRLDILVHGAGVGVHKEIVDMSDEEWDLQIDVQLRGAFLLSRAVGKQLIKQGGRWPNRLDRLHIRQQRPADVGSTRCLQGWRDPAVASDGPGNG